MIKEILLYFLSSYHMLINFFILKLRGVDFLEMPKIKGIIKMGGKGHFSFGEKVKINSGFSYNPVGMTSCTAFYVATDAKLRIGNNVGISNSLFYVLEKIEIEDNVLIGGGCQFLDNDFHSIDYENRILKGDKNVKSKPILIKEGAFIGTSSIILKGVTIGNKSVIAAGSIITKSVPDNEIWGGNPATLIRKLV